MSQRFVAMKCDWLMSGEDPMGISSTKAVQVLRR